mmetsp:Transcript_18067/g.46883  ORF Transcript_18067/g.46883 Transcript_18067/m.46883 type:complete len:283 (-) Transcript_18067:1228-2076(-)
MLIPPSSPSLFAASSSASPFGASAAAATVAAAGSAALPRSASAITGAATGAAAAGATAAAGAGVMGATATGTTAAAAGAAAAAGFAVGEDLASAPLAAAGGTALPCAMTAMRQPERGMCGPSAYKLSRRVATSSQGGSTYIESESPSLTTPALILDRKYLEYSSRAAASIGVGEDKARTVPLVTRLATSSNGTRCVMSKTFWLPAALRKATSTSCTRPCKSVARVDNRLPMLRAREIPPVQAGGLGEAAPSLVGAATGALATKSAMADPPKAPPSSETICGI